MTGLITKASEVRAQSPGISGRLIRAPASLGHVGGPGNSAQGREETDCSEIVSLF